MRLTAGCLEAGFEHFTALLELPREISDICTRDVLESCRQRGAGDGKHVYQFCGQTVCKRTVLRLLGVGESRVLRIEAGRPDMRSSAPAKGKTHPLEGPRAADAFSFLWGVYATEAEYSPYATSVPAVGDGVEAKEELAAAAERILASGDGAPELPSVRQAIRQHDRLLRKVLPPGNKKELYTQYVAQRNGAPTASYTTFKRVFRRHYAHLLGRDRFSKHAQCDECSELKALMHSARDPVERCRWACRLVDHQDAQQRDRQVYYKVRELSHRGLVLCIMQDGSDQERYRVVRVCRAAKEMEEAGPCPRLKLVGSLVHGVCACFSVLEDDLPKNTQTTVELLFSAIEVARRKLDESGKAFPPELWVQVDNTPAENKNQHLFSAMASLVAKGIFQTATVAFLRKGHTHEDLDGLWGVNAGELDHVTAWDTPDEIIEHTQRVMSRTLGAVPVVVWKLDFVRRWNDWKEGLGVEGFPGVTGKGSPHWFHFCLRRDLPIDLLPRVANPTVTGDPMDVMLEVREFMADVQPSQDIIVVAPARFAALVPGAPCEVLPRYPVCARMQHQLAVFCERLLRHYPEKTAAAAYIRQWMSRTSTDGLNRPLRLRFLERKGARTGAPHARGAATGVEQHCVYPVKAVSVTRSEARAVHRGFKRARGETHPPMDFEAYLSARASQGASPEEARQEWNGLIIIQSADRAACAGESA